MDVALSISPVRDAAGQVVGASKIAREITDRKQSEKALRESEQRFCSLAEALDFQVRIRTEELDRRNAEVLEQSRQLQELSQRLFQIQDDERQQAARELRDSAGHVLSELRVSLLNLVRETHVNPALAVHLTETEQMVQQFAEEIRTTSDLLHPSLLEEGGLALALRGLAAAHARRSGQEIDLNIAADFGRLPGDIENCIFRLVQESLTNIRRHAGGSKATVRISRRDKQILAEVQDRGKGMSPERLAEVRSGAVGLGLAGMRERLRKFNGQLEIESNTLGTKIRATVPEPLPGETANARRGRKKPETTASSR